VSLVVVVAQEDAIKPHVVMHLVLVQVVVVEDSLTLTDV
jgi:hypothetical protein